MQVAFGLSRMLAALDDYVLDVPDAAHLATLFLARAIVDELVPPAFLTRVLDALHADSLAIVVVRNTGRLLASTHAAELVLKVRSSGSRDGSKRLILPCVSGCKRPRRLSRPRSTLPLRLRS